MKKIIILLGIIILTGCGQQPAEENFTKTVNEAQLEKNDPETAETKNLQTTDFTQYNPLFRFQADFPADWQVEYVPEITSLNIYAPKVSAEDPREKSQIFIRYFEANSFLTLNTVEIINKTETTINDHSAVRYEIKKKDNIANFPHQPSWRNSQHKLIDIRLSNDNPSLFYVFSYNPELDQNTFEEFINSLVFDNDQTAWQAPLDQADKRITKKPFGIKINPADSPVQPEKFSGYHTGTDFETWPEEADKVVKVNAICDGELLVARKATGYGGVIVQSCEYKDESITVVYGHVDLDSLTKKIGDKISNGEHLTNLGQGFSQDTDGERKHLHLGIHLGSEINIAGYVQKESQLNDWLDYQKIIIE